jgi:branched-chain amino acid transport system permease protein
MKVWGLHLPRWAGWLVFAALLGLLPLLADSRFALSLLSQAGIACILCLSYWLLMGQGGMLSFGHAVYSGAGAFMAIYTLRWVEGGAELPVALIPLLGGLAAALLALPFGWLATRHSPTVFAMVTLGLGELAWATALMFPAVFGGESGLSADRSAGPALAGLSWGPPVQMYGLIAAYTWVSALAIYGFTRSPPGRLLNAVRDNPERVAFMGHDPRRVRLLAFGVAAFFAGVAGGLSALLLEIVTTEVLSSQRSAAVLVFTYLGGVAYFLGPLLGGLLMVGGQVLLSSWTPGWLLYLGLIFLAMVIASPGGVAAWLLAAPRHPQAPLLGRSACVAAAAMALAGVAGLIEMAYQLRLADTLGPELRFLGLTLHAHDASHWLGAGALSLMGSAVWWWTRRMTKVRA